MTTWSIPSFCQGILGHSKHGRTMNSATSFHPINHDAQSFFRGHGAKTIEHFAMRPIAGVHQIGPPSGQLTHRTNNSIHTTGHSSSLEFGEGSLDHLIPDPEPYTLPRAWSRSRIRSSAFSIPTLIRIRLSVNPIWARTSGGTEAWVMIAGCSIRLSTPPN